MGLTCRYIIFICWFSLMLVSALLLFARGFLLNRTVLSNRSSCHLDTIDCSSDFVKYGQQSPTELGSLSTQCMFSTKGLKSIILIVDALRYDFVEEHQGPKHLQMPYHNKLSVLNQLVNSGAGKLYKFVADPPTTTLQRLKGLTTGSLPTFVDIGSNFVSEEISEDNIIDQLISVGKNVVMLGDDTWTNIYPNRFLRQFPFPSFNVWDLDTVDTGVETHIFNQMKKTDWSLIIGHFLGVDHCGHKYGPQHSEMGRKLIQMNRVIGDVVSEMDNNTILFVMGDHGMTESGDHGGSSDMEVSAALFIYSKQPSLMSLLANKQSVQQIDFVPTFSHLMGIPIPFSNLGSSLIYPDFDGSQKGSSTSHGQVTKCSLYSTMLNAEQMTNYLIEYSKIHPQFSESAVQKLMSQYQSLKTKFNLIKTELDHKAFLNEVHSFMISSRDMCHSVWIQFDTFSMSRGLVLMFLTISLGFIIIDGLPGGILQFVIKGNFLWWVFFTNMFSIVASIVLYHFSLVSHLDLTIYFATTSSSIGLLSILIVMNWYSIAEHWYKLNKSKDTLSIITRVATFILCVCLFSNSYVVEENFVVSYLLISLLWICIADINADSIKKSILKPTAGSGSSNSDSQFFKTLLNSPRGKAIMLTLVLSSILRTSYYYWVCREEQTRRCQTAKTLSKTFSCAVGILTFSFFVTVSRLLLRNFGNLTGWSPTVFVSRYIPTLCVVCCGCSWVLNSLSSKMKSKIIFSWQAQLFPQSVFFSSVVALIIFYLFPLHVYNMPNRSHYNSHNVIPTLFNRLKNIMMTGGLQKSNEEEEEPVTVCGLATVYSAAFLNLSIFSTFISATLSRESHAPVTVMMVISLLLMSVVMAIVKYEKNKTRGVDLSTPWWSVLCWTLSSYHFFYSSGHQATFSSINWTCAGLFGNIASNLIPGGTLVLLNTFTSQIIHSLLLPFLVIMPHTLSIISPKLLPFDPSDKRGELELFQREDLRKQEMFSLMARYILLNALKVFSSMFSACIHSRHLMVWKIFAPKLIFEGVAFMVSIPFVLLSFLYVERISLKIKSLITTLS